MSQSEPVDKWWKKKGTSEAGAVKAWTPDPNKYHAPDAQEVMRMGGGITGAAMIPRANPDGTSRGFDAHRPGVFTVDPDKPGGGITIDPTLLNNDQINDALAQVGNVGGDSEEQQNNAFEALIKMGEQGAFTDPDRAVVAMEAEERDISPNAPRYDPRTIAPRPVASKQFDEPVYDTVQTEPEYEPEPEPEPEFEPEPESEPIRSFEKPSPAKRKARVSKPKPQKPTEKVQSSARMVKSAESQDQNQSVNLMMKQLSDLLSKFQTPAAAAKPMTYRAPYPTAPTQLVPDPANQNLPYQPAVAPTPKAPVIAQNTPDSISSLEIGFINALPEKPKVRVIFDMGESFGTIQANYHGVVEGAGCVVLVYDTRYESGFQFVPPSRDKQLVTITVPSTSKRYETLSIGLQLNLGALDFVILVLARDTNKRIEQSNEFQEDND